VGVAVTVNKTGRAPDVGPTVSHEAPAAAAAVKLPDVGDVMLMPCCAGAVPPRMYLKLSEVGEATKGGVMTIKLTLMVADWTPGEAMVTVPL
jgi:hypothetical protein